MSQEDISEYFGESHNCKNKKFENWPVPTENGESSIHLDELYLSHNFFFKSL